MTPDWRKEFDEKFCVTGNPPRWIFGSHLKKDVDDEELISFIEKVESSAIERTVRECIQKVKTSDAKIGFGGSLNGCDCEYGCVDVVLEILSSLLPDQSKEQV